MSRDCRSCSKCRNCNGCHHCSICTKVTQDSASRSQTATPEGTAASTSQAPASGLYPHAVAFTTPSSTTLCVDTSTVINHFWNRWKHKYLLELREAHRCNQRNGVTPPVSVGDVVLMYDDGPRGFWKLVRVENLLPERMNIPGGLSLGYPP